MKKALACVIVGFSACCGGQYKGEIAVTGAIPGLPARIVSVTPELVDLFGNNVVTVLIESARPVQVKVEPDSQKDGRGAVRREGDALPLPYQIYVNDNEVLPGEKTSIVIETGKDQTQSTVVFLPEQTDIKEIPAGVYSGSVILILIPADGTGKASPPGAASSTQSKKRLGLSSVGSASAFLARPPKKEGKPDKK
ncbi:MAG: hypothetical protein LBJ70_05115 [Holosporales bacterium]|nr:hypothetical protein [Holosporales bacterium]